MKRLLGPLAEPLWAVLRIVTVFLFICHGFQKFGYLGGMGGFVLPPLLIWARWIEVIGGSLVLIGLGTRGTAFVLSGEMAVAYFYRHAPMGFWPLLNGGEVTVFYCFYFLYLAARGPGKYSADAALKIE